MFENLLYSINVILPIFILVLVGWFLKKKGFLGDAFCVTADKLVFKIMLPCMLFLETARVRIDTGAERGRFVAFAVIGVSVSFLVLCLIVPLLVKENDKRGAIIQGAFRSNFTILGLPLARSMFGDAGGASVALLTPFVITLFNIYSVIELTVFAPRESRKSIGRTIADITVNTIKNPLIIAVLIGVVFMLTGTDLPVFADRTLSYLANATVALSLISLGAGITVSSIWGKLKYSLPAALFKTLLLPLAAVTAAYAAGFRGDELATLFVLFATPSAVSSYIMAKNMKSDGELAGQILLLTTVLCLFTIFSGIFVMRCVGWL